MYLIFIANNLQDLIFDHTADGKREHQHIIKQPHQLRSTTKRR